MIASRRSLALAAVSLFAIASPALSNNFSSDFSSLAPGTTLFGAAQVDGGFLKLIDPVNPSFGAYGIGLGSVQTFPSFHAQWQSLIGGGSGGGGDGYSFNVATDLPNPPSYGNPGEEGAGTGLSVTVDTFDNGGGEVGLEIKWKGTRVAFTSVSKDDDGSGNFLRKDAFVDASVDVSANGVATFNYDGNILAASLPGFSGLEASGFMFGARTGGANDRHWIDNLTIHTGGSATVPDSGSSTLLIALASAGLLALRRLSGRAA
jgi:hypothetical protein